MTDSAQCVWFDGLKHVFITDRLVCVTSPTTPPKSPNSSCVSYPAKSRCFLERERRCVTQRPNVWTQLQPMQTHAKPPPLWMIGGQLVGDGLVCTDLAIERLCIGVPDQTFRGSSLLWPWQAQLRRRRMASLTCSKNKTLKSGWARCRKPSSLASSFSQCKLLGKWVDGCEVLNKWMRATTFLTEKRRAMEKRRTCRGFLTWSRPSLACLMCCVSLCCCFARFIIVYYRVENLSFSLDLVLLTFDLFTRGSVPHAHFCPRPCLSTDEANSQRTDTKDRTLCPVRALMPLLRSWHCTRALAQETEPSQPTRMCSKIWAFLWRLHILTHNARLVANSLKPNRDFHN